MYYMLVLISLVNYMLLQYSTVITFVRLFWLNLRDSGKN